VEAQPQIVDLVTLCRSFPSLPKRMVRRDNILHSYESKFSEGYRILHINALEGWGKTTLMAQFAMNHYDDCISAFLTASSHYHHDPNLFKQDLFVLARWARKRDLPVYQDQIGSEELLMELHRLENHARRLNRKFYFVIDADVPDDGRGISSARELLDLLPLESPSFRFLISGPRDILSDRVIRKEWFLSVDLAPFSRGDARELFGPEIADEYVREWCAAYNGIPALLNRVCLQLKAGVSPTALIDDPPESLQEFHLIEWQVVDWDDETQIGLLAVLAYDRYPHTISSLSRILSVSEHEVNQLIGTLAFVEVSSSTGLVAYDSQASMKYARARLSAYERKSKELVVEELLRRPTSPEAVARLPGLYVGLRKEEEALKHLALEKFRVLMEKSETLHKLKELSEMGAEVANSRHETGSLARFVLQRGILGDLRYIQTSNSELEALLALGKFGAAMTLAQSAILLEDRLQMLAVVGRAYHRKDLPVDPELVKLVHQVYERTNIESLGSRGVEIASDLVYSCPGLASNLVERISKSFQDSNAGDWARVTLSVLANLSQSRQKGNQVSIATLTEHVTDPLVRRFAAEVAVLLSDYSAVDVIRHAEDIEDTSDRLFILQSWCKQNKRKSGNASVIKYALETAVFDKEFSPNAKVYRELAEALPYIGDPEEQKELVAAFDVQLPIIKELGPTEEYIRLLLFLFRTEFKLHGSKADGRLRTVLKDVLAIDDITTKGGCVARLIQELSSLDYHKAKRTVVGARNELQVIVSEILCSSAEHFYGIKSIIEAISQTDPSWAFSFTQRLNTRRRRELAVAAWARALLTLPDNQLNLGFLISKIADLQHPDLRDEVVLDVLERIRSARTNQDRMRKQTFALLNRDNMARGGAFRIHRSEERCRALCIGYLLVAGDMKYRGFARDILRRLEEAWQAIDALWVKIDIGYRIAAFLGGENPDLGQEWMQKTEQLKSDGPFGSVASARIYMMNVQLAIRAFAGILHKHHDTEEDRALLELIISRVPSYGHQAKLWSELALRYRASNRIGDSQHLVEMRVRPLVTSISRDDEYHYIDVLIDVFPSLYLYSEQLAVEMVEDLPRLARNAAYSQACDYLVNRNPPEEPFDSSPNRRYRITPTYAEMLEMCKLVAYMDVDWLIYYHMGVIGNLTSSKEFDAGQRARIARELEEVILNRLPDSENIKHDGYIIACKAIVLSIKDGSTRNPKTNDYLTLADEARRIPNISDMSLVLAMIADEMPRQRTVASHSEGLIREAKVVAESVSVALDQVERYTSIAEIASSVKRPIFRQYLKAAMQVAAGRHEPQYYRAQKRIIDMAHKLDPDLAGNLTSLVDADDARNDGRPKITKYLDTLNAKNMMANEADALPGDPDDYPEAAWKALGALNANRLDPVKDKRLRDVLGKISGFPLNRSYPVVAWAIQNAVSTYAATEHWLSIVHPLFTACCEAAEFAYLLTSKGADKTADIHSMALESDDGCSRVITRGDRTSALQFIRDWLANNEVEQIKIHDPFFGPEDLDFINLIRQQNPNCRVRVLTSKRRQDKVMAKFGDEHLQAVYLNYWRDTISDLDPPFVDITIVGFGSGSGMDGSPIHDRWWIAGSSGLRLGTSLNGMGNRVSEISVMSEEETRAKNVQVDQFLSRNTVQYKGRNLSYSSFTLP